MSSRSDHPREDLKKDPHKKGAKSLFCEKKMICAYAHHFALPAFRKLLAWLGGADTTAMAAFALRAPWLIAVLAVLVVCRSAVSAGVTVYIHPVEGSDEFMQGDNPSDTTTKGIQ